MNIKELIERLDDLAWQEQMNFEISERDSEYALRTEPKIERVIQELADEVTPALLDQLEKEDGYVAWALRMSRHVRGDNPARRAERYLNHTNSNVRYWAKQIVSA